MLALTAMSSFSDAHETPDIPLIAANLNRLVWSAQKQIWAVLRREDSRQRLSYSLAATFLGRMCLSGDVHGLSDSAWQLVRESIEFYQDVAPIIRDGTFRCVRDIGHSYQHPTGFQIVTIHDTSREKLLLIWHRFDGALKGMAVTLAEPGTWRMVRELSEEPGLATCVGDRVQWREVPAWSGGVMLLERRST